MDRRPSDRSEFRPRLDQERRHRGGNQERDRDAEKNQLIALRPVVDGASDERPRVETQVQKRFMLPRNGDRGTLVDLGKSGMSQHLWHEPAFDTSQQGGKAWAKS